MKEDIVLSLFDYSGNMVKPWAKAGYECYCVDIKHEGTHTHDFCSGGKIHYVEADMLNYLPPRADFKIVFAFPPCTNLAVSGARWFKDKGLNGLAEGIELVEKARQIAEWSDAPYMIENPVSTLSTYWRDPDYIFHPYLFDHYTVEDEKYSKKTCLWTGQGFNTPEHLEEQVEEYDDRIHKMPPSEDRNQKRSKTPKGFAKAVFEANN